MRSTKVDWVFVVQQIPEYGNAVLTMLMVGGLAIVLGWLIGVGANLLLLGRYPLLSRLVRLYVEVGRNTPLLIQLFLLYFGLPSVGIQLDAETCAVLALSFLGGAYFTELYRGGVSSIEASQWQAAAALGLSRWQQIRYVVAPQVWSRQLPASAATACFLLRETTVTAAIAVAEVMYTTTSGIALYYLTYEFLFLMTMSCLLVFLPLSYGLKKLEQRGAYVL